MVVGPKENAGLAVEEGAAAPRVGWAVREGAPKAKPVWAGAGWADGWDVAPKLNPVEAGWEAGVVAPKENPGWAGGAAAGVVVAPNEKFGEPVAPARPPKLSFGWFADKLKPPAGWAPNEGDPKEGVDAVVVGVPKPCPL